MAPGIIGLLGRSRAGKDSVAAALCNIYPDYQLVRLSYPLKEAACHLYDYTMDQVEGPAKEQIDPRWNKTPRQTIQSLTEYMMNYMGHDFFTRRLYTKYNSHIIIPDIRYEHDILEIKKRQGVVIKVERPVNQVHHLFENHIDQLQGDFTIINSGTLDDLYHEVTTLAKKL
jgi:hypothetical protein